MKENLFNLFGEQTPEVKAKREAERTAALEAEVRRLEDELDKYNTREYQEKLAAVGGSGVIAKAIDDSFTYALQLVTGEVFVFAKATDCGEYLHLEDAGLAQKGHTWKGDQIRFIRGVDVKKSAIVWVADQGE